MTSPSDPMPARDMYHENVKKALIKDGWTITDDPMHLKWGKKDMYVDLGAERLVAAEKGHRKIAVEVKSLIGLSEMQDFENALGQFVLYRSVLGRTDPERELFLAIDQEKFDDLFEEPIGQLMREELRLQLIIFDPQREVICKWIP
jgi:hypothetical protein